MDHESLPGQENIHQRFTDFVESRADIVLESVNYSEKDVTRESVWRISAPSQLIAVDRMHFKVMIDLGPDRTIYHELELFKGEQSVFWLGHDSADFVFSSSLAGYQVDTPVTHQQVADLISQLITLEESMQSQKITAPL